MKKLLVTALSCTLVACATTLRCEPAQTKTPDAAAIKAPQLTEAEQRFVDGLRAVFAKPEVAEKHAKLVAMVKDVQQLRGEVEALLQAYVTEFCRTDSAVFTGLLEKFGAKLTNGEVVLPIDNFYALHTPVAAPAA